MLNKKRRSNLKISSKENDAKKDFNTLLKRIDNLEDTIKDKVNNY
jgi:hypothetical protein